MTEAIAPAVQAKKAMPGASTNPKMNYALIAVVLLGVGATVLAMLVW